MIENIEGEVWVPIFRKYAISNMGRMASYKRSKHIVMKTFKQNRGYHLVHIRINGVVIYVPIHRLVATIFLKNIDISKDTVNHEISKDDNRAIALSWMSKEDNYKHAVDNGLIHRGSVHRLSKLDETQVKTIRKCSIDGLSQKSIAKYFGVTPGCISTIISRKSWAHI